MEILKVGRRDTSLVTSVTSGHQIMRSTTSPDFTHTEIDRGGIVHHQDSHVDVSIFRLRGNIERCADQASQLQPIVQLSPEANLRSEGEFLMHEVIVLGYPPIPWAADAHLAVFRGEVSAVINTRINNQRHFVISGMARGGFSGGPVISVEPPNAVIGVVTQSLGKNNEPVELGFIAATSALAVFETIAQNNLIIPAINRTRHGYIL